MVSVLTGQRLLQMNQFTWIDYIILDSSWISLEIESMIKKEKATHIYYLSYLFDWFIVLLCD